MTNQEYINLEEGLNRVRGNKNLFLRMLQMFLNSKEFVELEEQLANAKYDQAAETAHAIKGMTGNLSLIQLFETSTTLMNQLRNGSADTELIDQYHDVLFTTRSEVEKLCIQLKTEV